MQKLKCVNQLIQRSPLAAAVAFGLFVAPLAQAFEFEQGELKGSLDTTVSYGVSVRTEDPAQDLLGKSTINPAIGLAGQSVPGIPSLGTFPGSAAQIAAPGRFSNNREDGDVKYAKGDAFSNAFKITSELQMNWRDWGVFTRASYFYDFKNTNNHDFSDAAKRKVGTDFRLYDAFIFKNYSLGANDEVSGNIRFGKQVVSWGESTFIQNGINSINPVDISRLRVAGAELKEAFLPVNMLWGSVKLSEAVSMEAFYQLDWKPTEIDPSGTYFSSNDFASPGGTYIMLGFGTAPQPVWNPDKFAATCIIGQNASGQTHVANSDRFAELAAIYGPATAAQLLAVGCSAAGARLADHNARDTGQFGLAMRWYAEALNQTEFGFYAMNYHSRLPLLSGMAAKIFPLASDGKPAPNSAGLIVEYPEDIHLFGLSWNTTLPGGVAFQGEVSYRPNVPLQVDDVELLYAALTPLNQVLAGSGAPPAALFVSQLGSATPGQYVKGWRSHKMSQLQMTFTKAFGQVLGSDQVALVGEIGGTQVNLPNQSVLRYEGEGTDTGGGCDVADTISTFPTGLFSPGCLRNPQTLDNGFPTSFSWGYRLAAKADYNSVFGSALNLTPRLAFNHDVKGITPGPGGNFLEGRKSITLGVEGNLMNAWIFDVSYTGFSGAGHLNQIHDRDFASFSVKYSF